MKKLTMLILTALLFASCAHLEHSPTGADGTSECTSCKKPEPAGVKTSEPDCACCKK